MYITYIMHANTHTYKPVNRHAYKPVNRHAYKPVNKHTNICHHTHTHTHTHTYIHTYIQTCLYGGLLFLAQLTLVVIQEGPRHPALLAETPPTPRLHVPHQPSQPPIRTAVYHVKDLSLVDVHDPLVLLRRGTVLRHDVQVQSARGYGRHGGRWLTNLCVCLCVHFVCLCVCKEGE